MNAFLKKFLLPDYKNFQNLDRPETTVFHSQVILSKPFLINIYKNFHKTFKNVLNPETGAHYIELGSGGNFIKKAIPEVHTSDIQKLSHIDVCCSAQALPFKTNQIDGMCGINVLHHLKDIRLFLADAEACLKKRGKLIFIEPTNTLWGRFIYQNFHHEAFDPSAGWKVEGEGPLSDANGALPWIIFVRDRKKFKSEFPNLEIKKITYHTPFRYLISGGFTYKQLLPPFTYPVIRGIEILLSPLNRWIGMFMTIEVEKKES